MDSSFIHCPSKGPLSSTCFFVVFLFVLFFSRLEGVGMDGKGTTGLMGLTFHTNNDEDPYIELKDDDDEEEYRPEIPGAKKSKNVPSAAAHAAATTCSHPAKQLNSSWLRDTCRRILEERHDAWCRTHRSNLRGGMHRGNSNLPCL